MGNHHVAMLIVLIIASSIAVSMANRNWPYGSGSPKYTKKINVGGSSNWTFGFNYVQWASKYGKFYINDTLVFKYDVPSKINIHPHNVYLLADSRSYKTCNLTKSVKLADETQGSGAGFQYKLEKKKNYYFACGASNGFHCSNGTMKFTVKPQSRRC